MKKNRTILASAVAVALAATALLAGCGANGGNGGNGNATPTPASSVAADPSAQAAVSDIDGILQSTQAGLAQDAIPTGIDAPDPTGATVDASSLLTEAGSMADELSTPVPTVGS